MPDPFSDLLKTIAGQGLGYLLFVLAVCAIVWLAKEQKSTNAENAKALAEQYNKRLEEKDRAVAALENSNRSISLITDSNSEIADALRNLASMVSNLLRDRENEDKLWEMRLANLSSTIDRLVSERARP